MAIENASVSSARLRAVFILAAIVAVPGSGGRLPAHAAGKFLAAPPVQAHSEQGLLAASIMGQPVVQHAGFVIELLPGGGDDIPEATFGDGVAVSASGPFGVEVVYSADAIDGLVTRANLDGTASGAFVTGLLRPTGVALPQSGPHAGAMLIREMSDVWVVRPELAGDLDSDGDVDALDLVMLLDSWGTCPVRGSSCSADLNSDHRVDPLDLAELLAQWS